MDPDAHAARLRRLDRKSVPMMCETWARVNALWASGSLPDVVHDVFQSIRLWERDQFARVCGHFSDLEGQDRQYYPCELELADPLEFATHFGQALGMAHAPSLRERQGAPNTDGTPHPPRCVLDAGPGALVRAVACVLMNCVDQYHVYVPEAYADPRPVLRHCIEALALSREQNHANAGKHEHQAYTTVIEALEQSVHVLQPTRRDMRENESAWQNVQRFVDARVQLSHGLLSAPEVLMVNNAGDAYMHLYYLSKARHSTTNNGTQLRHVPPESVQALVGTSVADVVCVDDRAFDHVERFASHVQYYGDAQQIDSPSGADNERSELLVDLDLAQMARGTQLAGLGVKWVAFCWPPASTPHSDVGKRAMLPGGVLHERRVSADQYVPVESSIALIVQEQRVQVPDSEDVVHVPMYVYRCVQEQEGTRDARVRTWMESKERDPETRRLHWLVRNVQERTLGPHYAFTDYMALHHREYEEHRARVPLDAVTQNARVLHARVWNAIEHHLSKWSEGAHGRVALWLNSGMEEASVMFAGAAANARVRDTDFEDGQRQVLTNVCVLPTVQSRALHAALVRDALLEHAWTHEDNLHRRDGITMPSMLSAYSISSVHSPALERTVRSMYHRKQRAKLSEDEVQRHELAVREGMQQTVHEALEHVRALGKEAKDVRLVMVNNHTYGAFGAHMGACVLDALDHHVPDKGDSKRKRKNMKEMWVCFTQDPLPYDQSTHGPWTRHALVTLGPGMVVSGRGGARCSMAQRVMALYRRMPLTTGPVVILVRSSEEDTQETDEEDTEEDVPDPERSAAHQPDATTSVPLVKREALHDAAPVEAAVIRRAPVPASKRPLVDMAQKLVDALNERASAFQRELDTRRVQLAARPAELRRLDELERNMQQRTHDDLQAVQEFLVARGGTIAQLRLYEPGASSVQCNARVRVPRAELQSPGSLKLLLVTDPKKRRVKPLAPSEPILVPAPAEEPVVEARLVPSETVFDVVQAGPTESYRDEFLLYDDVIDGERSREFVLLYMAAHNLMQLADAQDKEAQSMLRGLRLRVTSEYARVVRGLDSAVELERVRVGQRTRAWLQNAVRATNHALDQYEKNAPTEREQQAHLRRELLRCLMEERGRASSLFVDVRNARAKRRENDDKYVASLYKACKRVKALTHASDSTQELLARFARIKGLARNATEFMKRVSEREVLGLQRLRAAYHVRTLVLHACLARYYRQALAERNVNTLVENVRAATDDKAHELVRSLAHLRVSDFLTRDVSNVARFLVLGDATEDRDGSLLPASPGAQLHLGDEESALDVFGRAPHAQLFEYLNDLWQPDIEQEPARINSIAHQIERRVDEALRYASPVSAQDVQENGPDVLMGGVPDADQVLARREQWERELPTPVFDYIACNLLLDGDQHRLCCNELDVHSKVLYTGLSELIPLVLEHGRQGRVAPSPGSPRAFVAYRELVRYAQQQPPTSTWYWMQERIQQRPEEAAEAERLRKMHQTMRKVVRVDAHPNKREEAKDALYKAMARYCVDAMHSMPVWQHFGASLEACLTHVSDMSEALGTNQVSSVIAQFQVPVEHAWIPRFFEALFEDNARGDVDLRTQRKQLDTLLIRCAQSKKERSAQERTKVHQAAALVMDEYAHTMNHVINVTSALVMQCLFQGALVGFVVRPRAQVSEPSAVLSWPHEVDAYAHRYAIDLQSIDGMAQGGLHQLLQDRRESMLYKREPTDRDKDRPRQNLQRHDVHARTQYLECCARIADGVTSVRTLLDRAAATCAFMGETCRDEATLAKREHWVRRDHPETANYAHTSAITPEYRDVSYALAMSIGTRMDPVRYCEYLGWAHALVRASFHTLRWSMLQQEDGSFWDDRNASAWPDFFVHGVATPHRFWLVRYDPENALGAARTHSPNFAPHVWPSVHELVQSACHAALMATTDDILGVSVYDWEHASGRDQWLSTAPVLGALLEHQVAETGAVSVLELAYDGQDVRFLAHVDTIALHLGQDVPDIVRTYAQGGTHVDVSVKRREQPPVAAYMTTLSLAYPTVPADALYLGPINDVFVAQEAPAWLAGRLDRARYAQLARITQNNTGLEPVDTRVYAELMAEYDAQSTPVRASDVRKRRRSSPTGLTPPGKEQTQRDALSLPLDMMLAGALQAQIDPSCGASSVASVLAAADLLGISHAEVLHQAAREAQRDIAAYEETRRDETTDLLEDLDEAFLQGVEGARDRRYSPESLDPDDPDQVRDRLRALVADRARDEMQTQEHLGTLPKTVQNFMLSWYARQPEVKRVMDRIAPTLWGAAYAGRLQDPELLRDMARASSTLPQVMALDQELYRGVPARDLDAFKDALREYINPF